MVDKSTDYKESCSVPRKLSEQFSTRALIDCAAANLINKLSTGLWKFQGMVKHFEYIEKLQ